MHPFSRIAAALTFSLAVTLHAAPVVSTITPPPGSTVAALTSVSVTFSEPVTDVNATDLGVNGEPIVLVTGSGAGPYVFSFPQPAPGSVTFGWDVDLSIAGIGTGLFVPAGGWSYTLTDTISPTLGTIHTSVAGQEMDDVLPASGATVASLTSATVRFSEPVTGVSAADLLVNGIAATALTGDTAGPYVFTFPQPGEGAVNFTWAGGHAIQDLAGNAFGGAGWSVTRAALAGTVVITEFLVSNGGTAVMAGSDIDGTRDENWDLSSWIELYNPGPTDVNLLGWTLTGDLTNPAQWVFPSRTLAAGGRLIVFASGKDRKPASGNLHTNFGLGDNAGTLALFPPDATAASPASSWVNYPPQRYDFSYGAQSTDGLPRYFKPPTVIQGAYTLPSSDIGGTPGTTPPAPSGADNGTSTLTAVTPEPHASVARGFFNEPFTVVLSCPDAAATIRYTLDGSSPLSTSTAYAAPLSITGTTVLRMAAFGTDKVSSRMVTHTYLFPDQVVSQPSPPYDNPALTTDNTNPQPPAPGGSPLPIAWGNNGTFTAAQTLPGFPTGTATGANNLNAGQIPADYGMDPKVYADPTKYNDAGAVDAVNGKTNLERISNCLRTQPALSLVMKSADMFGAYPNGTTPAGTIDPLYPTSSSGIKRDMTKPCSLEFMQPDGTTVFVTDCGIDLHGNASRDPFKNPKHGFTIRFKGKFGAGKVEGKIFPDSPVREWDKLLLRGDFGGSWLHQNGTDGLAAGSDNYQRPRGIRVREAFCKDTFRDMGRVASHHRFCNLFINGVCWGSYELMEDQAEDFSASYLGGNQDEHDVVDQGKLKSGTWNVWSSIKTLLGWTGGTATTDNTTPPASYLNTFTNTQYETLRTRLDLPWFQDYMIWQTWAGHRDWATDAGDAGKYMKNVYFIRPKGGTFKAMPWDMENLLWHEGEDRITGMTTFAAAPSLFPPAVIHPRTKTNAEYRQEFADRAWRHLIRPGGALTPAANIARLVKWTAAYGVDSVVLESARWGDYRYKVHAYTTGTTTQVYTWNGAWYDNNTSAQYNGAWASGVTKFNTGRVAAASLGTYTAGMSNAWYDEIRRLNTVYFPARTNNVLTQYRNNGLYPHLNAPELHHNTTDASLGDTQLPSGTLVKLVMPAAAAGTSSLGDIYYTTDGTDPRAAYDFNGTPRPGASLYSSPFAVTAPAVVKARALARPASFPAKAPVRAASTVAIAISYNATGGASARGQITAAPLALDGLTLAAGDRILLKNQAAAAQNGIWSVTTPGTGATGVWDRAEDWDADGEVVTNTWARVSAGLQNQDSLWRVTSTGSIFVGGATGTSVIFAANGFTPWSALLEITLTVGPPLATVCISEINYNPRSSQGGSAAEFVEFLNFGTLPVNMTSWSTDGIDFIFPAGFTLNPGQRVLIASNNNPVTFAAQYPGVVPLGYFAGTLDNGGERLSLLDAKGNVVCSVEFDDSAPWPAGADNGGYSLELISPNGDIQSVANWKASASLKGTPGAANSMPAAGIVFTEFFAAGGNGWFNDSPQPDFVEIRNNGASQVNLTGWTANGAPFAALTLVPGARTVAHPPLPVASGEIILRDASGVVVDGFRYGHQFESHSFFRNNGTWVFGDPTPGAPDVAAEISSPNEIRLNEMMANPVPGEDDWIELYDENSIDPIVLTGCTLDVNGEYLRIDVPAVILDGEPLRFFCNPGGTAGDTFNISLPAAGGTITLRDPAWNVCDTLAYGPQQEGVTLGRINTPPGAAFVTLPYPTPGGFNVIPPATRPVLNEVLVINRDGVNAPWARRPAWIEIRNPAASDVWLGSWSLRTASESPVSFRIPDTLLAAGGFLTFWCDPAQPASTATGPHLNAPLPIDAEYDSWGIELVDNFGSVMDRITWGPQLPDRSIGRLPDNTWALLSTPTRGAPNASAAPLAPATGVKLNEWMGGNVTLLPLTSFIEIYNPASAPTALGGLWLGDEPSETGRRKWQIPALTFVAAQRHVLFTTGEGTSQPTRFLFDLASGGEYVRLSQNDAAATVVDAFSFGAPASTTLSQGRLPDGSGTTGPLTPTPGTPNNTAPGPAIVRQPVSRAVPAGQSTYFIATASGYTSLQWLKNGQPIANSNSFNLTLSDITAADEADYTFTATNAAGTSTSAPAHLTVLYTYDAFAAEKGLGSINADADNDGLTNGDEFLAGTDPLGATPMASGVAGGFESIAGTNYLTLEYSVSRRAAYTSLASQRSSDLSLWSDAAPAITEPVSTQPNGDYRVKVKFPWLPGDDREFVRLRLVP